MNREDRLADLIDRWEELRREGKSPTAAELARESPELIAPLREWITAFDLADQLEARAASRPGKRWRLDAEPVSFQDLTNTILAHGLVSAVDLDRSAAELEKAKTNPTAFELSSELIQRGWITAEQSEILLAGGGGELVVGEYVLLDPSNRPGKQRFHARHRSRGELVVLERALPNLVGPPVDEGLIRTKEGVFRVRECPGPVQAESGRDNQDDVLQLGNSSPSAARVSPHDAVPGEPAPPGEFQWSILAITVFMIAVIGSIAGWFFSR
jgi:hypothetical protein